MAEQSRTVTSKGQVTIPKEIRRALNIRPKDKVAFELVDREVRLRPIVSPVLSSFGAVKPKREPEDFRKMRQEVEEEWGEEVGKEG